VDWYRLPDTITPVASGVDYLYAEHGEGYMIKLGELREVFWVFDYDSLRADITAIDAILSCTETELQLEGRIPAMQYTNLQGKRCTYPRQCRVSYMDAMWSGESEAWVDSLAQQEADFKQTVVVGASPVATDFTISDPLAALLELSEDSLRSPVYSPMALKANPLAIVTTRGKEGETSNEVERPIDPSELIRRSAPLIVTFRANALNADYYQWNIYRGSDRILQRNEAQHQYTFTEPGNYRAVVGMSNSHDCQLDSVEFLISVSESMLTVPNVFTPNGDGMNDEFRVVYRSIKEFHCWVYNRWGHKVYEWTDPAKGWDGTIGGKPAAEGAYYYVIRALGTDAESDYILKPLYTKKLKKQELPIGVYQLSGDIYLIRGGK
jgi:gliding motility-associated-like protein